MGEKKKKKILILVNTYFQIMTAVKLKNTKYVNDKVDIIISDHSVDSEKIYNRIIESKIFNKAYYFKSKEDKSKRNIKKLYENFCFLLFPDKSLKKNSIVLDNYDEFIFYNINKFTVLLYDSLYKKNKNLKLIRFEEGYISYLHLNSGLSKEYNSMRKLLCKANFLNNITLNYLYNLDLLIYEPVGKIEKIDNLDRSDKKTINEINKIFDYNSNINKIYNKKYIFFEESFFCDKKGVDDFKLILDIAKIVSKENLLIKLHPRNKINRFEKYGIATNKTIGIPWELIQMNDDFSDKVLLTISSGSVLASKLYFNDNIKTFLLFNCTDKISDMVTNKYFEYLKKLENKFGLNDFIIPKNEKEFLMRLERGRNE